MSLISVNNTQYCHKAPQSGFTLLELLLVVTILSSTAMVAMMTMETSTSQHRIEGTESRLMLLNKATVQRLDYDFNHDGIIDATQLKGYVVDNGRLPECVAGLMPAATKVADDCLDATDDAAAGGRDMQNYDFLAPVFDPVPTANFNDGSADEIALDQENERLWKGFRPVYLGNVVRDEFRDSWGNFSAADDDKHWGWERDVTDGALSFTSFGRDNVVSDAAAYPTAGVQPQDEDLTTTVHLVDWAQEFNHDNDSDGTDDRVKIVINISNTSLDDVVVPSNNYSLVLLEFVNGEDRRYWRQSNVGMKEKVDNGVKYVPRGDVYIADGDYSDTLQAGGSILLELELENYLAVGEHILMLVAHDGTGLTNTTPPCLDIDGDNAGAGDGLCVNDDDADATNDDGATSNYDDDGADNDQKADRLTKKFTVLPDGYMYTAESPAPVQYTINWVIE